MVVSILACAALQEISRTSAYVGVALVITGMVFSYHTRARPPMWVKGLVALAAVAVLVWFFHQVSGHSVPDITTVENPLTVLFVWIQVVHSFHVPARRDLLFSLGGSAGLMAVAAAQAIDLHFGVYALAWFGFGLWGLVEMWASASQGGRVSTGGLGSTVVAISTAAVAIFLVLPAPSVAVRINFLARSGGGGAIPVPGALAGDGGKTSELSRPGSPAGPTRVGGYLGFANSLDTALRGSLGQALVMRVRAERPSYWIGETFDRWDGQSWATTLPPPERVGGGSPFFLPTPSGDNPDGAVGPADLLPGHLRPRPGLPRRERPRSVVPGRRPLPVRPTARSCRPSVWGRAPSTPWSPRSARRARPNCDSRTGGPGAVDDGPPPLHPAAAPLPPGPGPGRGGHRRRHDHLRPGAGPDRLDRGATPATRPTSRRCPRGADTVNEFLFGNRVGFCEQISTSLAVMLRTLGIPAREAVGYVPGPYNPITDLYEVRAEDAHAWVQVWLPGYGWQSFDPTASVPLANPDPGTTALQSVGRALGHLPPAPIGTAAGAVALAVAAVRWRRSRPTTWAERLARRMERAGRRAGRPRLAAETIVEYATALDGLSPDRADGWRRLGLAVQSAGYGGPVPSEETQRQLLVSARRMRIARRRRHRTALRPGLTNHH